MKLPSFLASILGMIAAAPRVTEANLAGLRKPTPPNRERCSRDVFGNLHRHPITPANVNTDPVHMHSKARQRYFAGEDQATADLAAKAAGGAL